MIALSQALAGNSDAAAQVIETIAKRVRFLCTKANYKITAVRADADDAAQMALVRIYQALVAGDCAAMDQEAFNWFVFKQARNACRLIENTHGRKKRAIANESSSRDDVDAGVDAIDTSKSAEAAAQDSELVDQLLGLVTRDDDRFILEGIRDGFSVNEIAAALEVVPGFVYTRIERIRKKAKVLVS